MSVCVIIEKERLYQPIDVYISVTAPGAEPDVSQGRVTRKKGKANGTQVCVIDVCYRCYIIYMCIYLFIYIYIYIEREREREREREMRRAPKYVL